MSLNLPAGTGIRASITTREEAIVPPHVEALETALRLTQSALRVLAEAPATFADLKPAAETIGRAISATSRGFDGSSDPLLGVRDAIVEVDRARELLVTAAVHDPPLEELREWLATARGWLLVAEARQARVAPIFTPPTEVRAAAELPRLHHVERSALSPFVKVVDPKIPEPVAPRPPTSPLERAKSFEEVEQRMEALKRSADERRAKNLARRQARAAREDERTIPPGPTELPGFVKGKYRALSEKDFVTQKARECLEEVAMLGMHRTPQLGDPWRTASVFEKRLLAVVDALVGLGDRGIAAIEPLIFDSPAKTPPLVFAAGFLGGCLTGRDPLAMAERVFRHFGPDEPEVTKAFAAALKLVPSPHLAPMLRSWLKDPTAGVRAVAVDTLSYLGLVTEEELTAACSDPEASVQSVALVAAGELKIEDLERIVDAARESEDKSVRKAALWAMMLGGTSFASDRLEKELTGPFEDLALIPLGLGAELRHAETIAGRLSEGLTFERTAAAGWAGSPLAFEGLLAGLAGRDPEVALHCAFALDRITGAGLWDTTEIPPEQVSVPDDVPDPETGEEKPPPLARVVTDPRDLPSDGSNDRMLLPSTRYDRWSEYLAREAARYRPDLRYRRGHPFTPAVAFTELDRFPLIPFDRRCLHRELIIRTGQRVAFDPHDFVAVQEASLRLWGPIAFKASSQGGGWSRARRLPLL